MTAKAIRGAHASARVSARIRGDDRPQVLGLLLGRAEQKQPLAGENEPTMLTNGWTSTLAHSSSQTA